MKRFSKTTVTAAALAAGFLITAHRAQAQFTSGDLVVEQFGTTGSTTALTSAGTAVYVDEFAPAGTGQSTALQVALPTANNGNQLSLVDSGTGTSDGFLSRSADGQYLVVGGYNSSVGTAGVSSSSASTTPRVIGRIGVDGTVDTTTSSKTAQTGVNIRGVAAVNGTTFYSTGGSVTPPLSQFTFGSSSSTDITITASGSGSTTNLRNAEIFTVGGTPSLYYSSGSGTSGIYTFGGLPSSSPAAATQLIATTGTSPYGFSVSPDGKTVYVADSSAGIQKYTSPTGATGSFTLAYTDAKFKALGLTVDYSGANPILYATSTATSANTLVSITDDGVSTDFTGNAGTLLATAGANTVFKGVDFAPVPVPEPATWVAGALSVLTLAWAVTRQSLGRFGVRGA